jgi:hypothetical protein
VSEFTAVRDVSVSLKELLEHELTNSGNTQLAVPIELQSPRVLRQKGKIPSIALWLYMMKREPDTLNLPPQRPTSSQVRRRPLPLTLHYLICALHDDPRDEQMLLGKVAQVFHDHSILEPGDLLDSLAGADQLRLVLDAPTLEELSRVWDSLNEPYQLSLAYTVQVVRIDSDADAALRPPVLTSTQLPGVIVGGGQPWRQ